jgi:signal transduction histidine kinase
MGHSGTIEVESRTDAASHGTTFRISLPLENAYAGDVV